MQSIVEREDANLKPLFLYIPESFEPSTCGHWADYAAYVLSTVNRRIVFEKLDPDGYVPLMSALLKRVLPKRDYRKILQLLIDQDVIECDRSYQVGTKSKGYRLTARYRGQVHRRHLVTDTNLIAKLKKLREDMEAGIVLPVHRHLWKYLQQIDFAKPLPDFGMFNRQVQEVLDKDFRLSVCQFGSRVHTNISNMKKSIRKYLRYNGQELSNIDIANSQPLFLGVSVLNHYINQGQLQTATSFTPEEMIFNSPEILFLHLQREEEEEEEREVRPLCGNITQQLELPEDLRRYLRICEKGKLYEYLMEIAGERVDREGFKPKCYQVMMGETKLTKHTPLGQIWEREFPTVTAVMNEVKKRDYLHMARMLQRTESAFAINRVVRRMMNEYPDVFIGTIYDSFVTTTEHVDILEKVIYQEFFRLGLRPLLRTERLVAQEVGEIAA